MALEKATYVTGQRHVLSGNKWQSLLQHHYNITPVDNPQESLVQQQQQYYNVKPADSSQETPAQPDLSALLLLHQCVFFAFNLLSLLPHTLSLL